MSKKTPAPGLEAGVFLASLAAAAVLFWGHSRQPYSEPARAVEKLFRSCNAPDLKGFQAVSTPSFYAAFVRHFGDQKLRQVGAI